MEAPKNSQQKFMGDTATIDVPTPKFQKPEVIEKVPSVKAHASMPTAAGVNTPSDK